MNKPRKMIYMDTENGDDKKDGSNWENAIKTQDRVLELIDPQSGDIVYESD